MKKVSPAVANIVLSTQITFEGVTQRFLVFAQTKSFFKTEFDPVGRPIHEILTEWLKKQGVDLVLLDSEITMFHGRTRNGFYKVELPVSDVLRNFPADRFYHVESSNFEADMIMASAFLVDCEKEEVAKAFPLLQPLFDFFSPLQGLLPSASVANG